MQTLRAEAGGASAVCAVPSPSPPPPPPSCPVCMHSVPGKTCDAIANEQLGLPSATVCHQLHEVYGCDCSGCECLSVPPSPPAIPPPPPTLPPPLPPSPPVSPPGEDPIQIFALVLLIVVIFVFCGSLCLVAFCLLGWLDQGALRFPAGLHQCAHTTHHTTRRRRHLRPPPAARAPVRLAVAGELKRKPAEQMQRLMAWGKRRAAQKVRRARGQQSPVRLQDGERSPSMSPSAATPDGGARGSSMAGIALCEITSVATPSNDPAAGGAG